MAALELIGNTMYMFATMQIVSGMSWLSYFFISLFVIAIIFIVSTIRK